MSGELECSRMTYILFVHVFGQAFASNNLLIGVDVSLWNIYFEEDISTSRRSKKPTSSNVVTSFWMRLIPSYIAQIEGTTNLLTAYLLPMFLTRQFWLLWQKQKLWTNSTSTLTTNITRNRNAITNFFEMILAL
jgi:hypothetical protein